MLPLTCQVLEAAGHVQLVLHGGLLEVLGAKGLWQRRQHTTSLSTIPFAVAAVSHADTGSREPRR